MIMGTKKAFLLEKYMALRGNSIPLRCQLQELIGMFHLIS